MKAAHIYGFGDPSVFKIEETNTPEVAPGHVLIKIMAAGINRLEHYIRNGDFLKEEDMKFPHILGADASGIIDAVAADVSNFKVGDKVIPMTGYPVDPSDYDISPATAAPSFQVRGVHSNGTYTQYMIAPARWVVKDPTDLPHEQAATLPMVLLTAVRAAKVMGEVKDGDVVLVQAGASGTGSMMVQVAKALGARVLTTVRSPEKIDFVKSLGATRVIDTGKEDFLDIARKETGGKGVDVVLDGLGGDIFTRGIAALRSGGIIVTYGFVTGAEAKFNLIELFFTSKQIRGAIAGNLEDLTWGLDQVKLGRVKPLLHKAFPLSQVSEAHRLVAENKVQGNLALLPWA